MAAFWYQSRSDSSPSSEPVPVPAAVREAA